MDAMGQAELGPLFAVVLACLCGIVVAIALLVRAGRTVSFGMLERPSGTRATSPSSEERGARPPARHHGLPPPRAALMR